MENLIIFDNEQFGEIRTLREGKTILFCGADVAKALGYARPNDAISAHCKGAVKRRTLTNGGMQELSFIPEKDIYRLAFGSKLASAEKFTDWVTEEVLPSIRETGGYQMQKQMTPAEITLANAQAIVDHERRMNAIEDSVKSIDEKLTGVVDTFTAPTADSDVWQIETRKAVTKLIQDNKLSYQAYWADLYERLELRAGVNLETRKKRLKERLAKQGVAKHVINNVSKLLVISQDKKLVDIFNSIVREEKAKYVLLKGGRTA